MKPSLFFTSILLGLSAISSYAQIPSSTHILQYASDSHLFSEGLAAVQLGAKWELEAKNKSLLQDQNGSSLVGKWGYMDKSGQLTINVRFDEARDFSNGLAAVKIEKKWGLIDKNAKFVVAPKYDSLFAFEKGYITLLVGSDRTLQAGLIDKKGKTILEPKYHGVKILDKELFAPNENNLLGVVNAKGEWLIKPLLNSITPFINDHAVIGIKSSGSIQYGAIDKNGTIFIQPAYDALIASKDGAFIYRNDLKWGVLNPKGERVSEAKYDVIRPFYDGLAAIKLNNKWGFIDTNGTVVVEPQHDFVGNFSQNRAVVGDKQGLLNIMHFGYINTYAQNLTEMQYRSAKDFSEGVAAVCSVGFVTPSCGYIDENGTQVIKDDYAVAKSFKNGFAKVATKTSMPLRYFPKYLNKHGDIILEGDEIKPIRNVPILIEFFLDASIFINPPYNGVSTYRKDKKWGLIDQSGKIVQEATYKSLTNFQEGLAKAVTQDGKVCYINEKGNIVLE